MLLWTTGAPHVMLPYTWPCRASCARPHWPWSIRLLFFCSRGIQPLAHILLDCVSLLILFVQYFVSSSISALINFSSFLSPCTDMACILSAFLVCDRILHISHILFSVLHLLWYICWLSFVCMFFLFFFYCPLSFLVSLDWFTCNSFSFGLPWVYWSLFALHCGCWLVISLVLFQFCFMLVHIWCDGVHVLIIGLCILFASTEWG